MTHSGEGGDGDRAAGDGRVGDDARSSGGGASAGEGRGAAGRAAGDAGVTGAGEDGASQVRYVLNARSKVYHLPDTPCAGSIAERNRRESNEDVAALEAKGYRPCGSCHPERAG